MYYWIVILFSLATVMTYKMAGTDGEFEKRIAPVMESTAAGIVQQHNSAYDYIENNINYSSIVSSGVLPTSLFAEYGAYGKKDSSDYTTVLICVNTLDYKKHVDCASNQGINFLITYGEMPEKWKDEYIEAYFKAILGRYSQRTDQFGVLEEDTNPPTEYLVEGDSKVLGSSYVVNSVKGKHVYVPHMMYECIDQSIKTKNIVMYVTQLNHLDDNVFIENTTVDGECNLTATAP